MSSLQFVLPTPFVHEDVEYPFCGVQLVTNPAFNETSVGAQVVLALTPYRVAEDNTIQVAPDGAGRRSFVFGDAYAQAQSDPTLAAALVAISQALQTFISARA
jgi:hypothetical protein